MASPLVFRPKCVVVYRISKDIDLSNLAEQLKEFAAPAARRICPVPVG